MTRGIGGTLAVMVLGMGGIVSAAEPVTPADAKAFDKAVVDALRDVHNHGADLYNQGKDYPGAYRVYEGALRTVKPLLGHRPAVQKVIADGLAAAAKVPVVAEQAFLLHETIEKVRAELKGTGPAKKPDTAVAPVDPKKVDDTKPDVKKSTTPSKKPDEVKKPATPVDPVPPPRVKKPVAP